MDLKLHAIDSHPQKRGKEPIEDKDAATGSRLQENDSHSQDRGKKPIESGDSDSTNDKKAMDNSTQSPTRAKRKTSYPQFRYVHVYSYRKWNLCARVEQKLKVQHFSRNKRMKILLVDVEGSKLEASVYGQHVDPLQELLHEGKVYSFTGVGVRGSSTAYKLVDSGLECLLTKKQSGTAKLLQMATLIIWDEASMSKRQAIEALNITMQDVTGSTLPFGGKIMIFGGDFRQVLPVVRKGTRAQIVDSSLRMSLLWPLIKKIQLTHNMRALSDPWFSEYLLKVGDGTEESIGEDLIRIPDEMIIPYTPEEDAKQRLIDVIFPQLNLHGNSTEYVISRAILSTKNEYVDELNQLMIEKFPGYEKLYYSFDKAEDDLANHYPTEFLNSLTLGGLPPHVLKLKLGCPIILLRNLDPANGLCNGTRLICRHFQNNAIDAEIAIGHHAGKRIFLTRIPLHPSDDEMFPFKFIRKQFPIRLSFAMTINKAQGQAIPNVGVYLPKPVFSYGQLYVALSRGTSRLTTKVMLKPTEEMDASEVYTKNIVYREVLNNE